MKHLCDYGLAFRGLTKDGLASLGMVGIDLSGGVTPPSPIVIVGASSKHLHISSTGSLVVVAYPWLMQSTFPQALDTFGKYVNADTNTINFAYYVFWGTATSASLLLDSDGEYLLDSGGDYLLDNG